jgi:hypothetical protein
VKTPALDTFQNILFMELRPWMATGITEAKYKQLLLEIKKEHFSFQPLHDVDFPKPLNAKRKYYYALIENDVIQYLNIFTSCISGALNENEKKYWVHNSLNKILPQKFKDTKEVIEFHKYDLEKIIGSSGNSAAFDDGYIIQFLRLQVLRIFLEIQDAYKDYASDEVFSFEELNAKYYSDSLPKSFIKEATKLKLNSPTDSPRIKSPTIQFVPRPFDFRPDAKGILSYKAIIKNADRFSRFEERLFTNELIDENYNFRDQHGQIQELAAVFQTLFQKGYFNKLKFPGQKPIKPVEIRKFLDHRYNSKTDKQFREWGNNPDKLATFTAARWIDNLPVS